nr:hypothetical protein HAGR004_41520 [Bdellovibrio sp. HAGR004]
MRAVEKINTQILWGSYPDSYAFAVADPVVNSVGFLLLASSSANDGQQSQSCENFQNLEPIGIKTYPESTGYFPHCSEFSDDKACMIFPELKQQYLKIETPISLLVLDRTRFEEIQGLLFGKLRARYSPIQLSIYHSFHEMFHDYQDRVGLLKNASLGGSYAVETYRKCADVNADWSRKYARERAWWKKNFLQIYSEKTSRTRLVDIAKEFIKKVRPEDASEALCNEALARYEMHEGTAHFVGNLAVLRAGLIKGEALANIDKQYLDTPREVHGVMHVYATGGGISMLLERLTENQWKSEIQRGLTPYEILRNFVEAQP